MGSASTAPSTAGPVARTSGRTSTRAGRLPLHLLLVLASLILSFASVASSSSPSTPHLTELLQLKQTRSLPDECKRVEEDSPMTCRCCKVRCWHTVASAAAHELGHIPGEAGQQEALATLQLVRACMIEQCGAQCLRPRLALRSAHFLAAAAAAAQAQQQQQQLEQTQQLDS